MKRQLYFTENLEIPNGMAEVPAMLWLANKRSLKILLLQITEDQQKNRTFLRSVFNVYENGNVCMGTVDVNIQNSTSLEEFTKNGKIIFLILISAI